ncbi:ATP-binding protein [Priestia koreensis]|uniref:ATP-binding protein n=1 Tax=Priestia koreensis TaxID=284581 RepID=UPI003D027044
MGFALRSVPLILAFVYGGRKSGFIVLGFILCGRTMLGGNALIVGYISVLISALFPFLLAKMAWGFSARKRIIFTIILGLGPSLVQLSILLISTALSPNVSIEASLIENVISFGTIQLIGICMASLIYEWMIERKIMKEKIHYAEKLNTLGELAASIAHEVRNPLTVVKGFLQLMNHDQKKERGEYDQYIPLVLSELNRAESIISDYLTFAKPQFPKIEVFSLSDMLYDVLALLNPLAVKQGVNLHINVQIPLHLETDQNQLKQVFINLIKNSIEATDNSGTVTIHAQKEDDYVCVQVIDDGKGMNKEQLARIGTLFYTTKDRGTGLGTMVSLRIIEAMDGKITYKSEEGKGTEVHLLLPLNLERSHSMSARA